MTTSSDSQKAGAGSLRNADIAAIKIALEALPGAWTIEAHRDDDGDRWAAIVPVQSPGGGARFIVTREPDGLCLTGPALEPLGVFRTGSPLGAAMARSHRAGWSRGSLPVPLTQAA